MGLFTHLPHNVRGFMEKHGERGSMEKRREEGGGSDEIITGEGCSDSGKESRGEVVEWTDEWMDE